MSTGKSEAVKNFNSIHLKVDALLQYNDLEIHRFPCKYFFLINFLASFPLDVNKGGCHTKGIESAGSLGFIKKPQKKILFRFILIYISL